MPTYAIIIPTLNEANNVTRLTERLHKLLQHLDWEVIFVDDNSTDGTLQELHTLAKNSSHVRYIRRLGRRGLASACIEGMMSTTATYMAIMDADLQHDESKLLDLFALLSSGEATVAVASRYTGGGSTGEWEQSRVSMSKFATKLAKKSLYVPCSDPMSGFFAIHRDIIDKSAEGLQRRGFKILLDILTTKDLPLILREVPYTFRERTEGSTKLSYSVMFDFAWLLLQKYMRQMAYIRFIIFCCIGLSGVLVHLAVLGALHIGMDISFIMAQSIATFGAMTSNYILNNTITFAEQKLVGKNLLIGYVKFVASCLLGAFINVAVAEFFRQQGVYWMFDACLGIIAGSFINYAFSRFFIWKNA